MICTSILYMQKACASYVYEMQALAISLLTLPSICRMSHPVTALNTSFLTVNNGAGKIEGVGAGSSSGQLCSNFEVSTSLSHQYTLLNHLCLA